MTEIPEEKAEPHHRAGHVMEDRAFLLLIVAVSLAFGWILWPFHGAVLWAIVLAILFAPLYRRLTRSMRQSRTLAALATVVIVVLLVILPLALVTASLVREASGVYERIQSGGLNFGRLFQQVLDALPAWATSLLDRFGLTNFGEVLERFSSGLLQGSQFLAARALSIGQNTVEFLVNLFLMLYLLFFLLRDGEALVRRIRAALPLRESQKQPLFSKFAIVIRATVKGNIVVAIVQGSLGGLIFWLLGIHAPMLWGVLMAFLSLLPAVGAAVVWLPVAVYLLATGNVWDGIDPDRLRHVRDRPRRQRPAPDPGRQRHQDARLRRADLDPRRHRRLRPQRLRHRPGHRRDVHRELGPVRGGAGADDRPGPVALDGAAQPAPRPLVKHGISK